MRPTFEQQLEALINACSMENGSNTPDFILAAYLTRCLEAYNHALRAREQWYGRAAIHERVVNADDSGA